MYHHVFVHITVQLLKTICSFFFKLSYKVNRSASHAGAGLRKYSADLVNAV